MPNPPPPLERHLQKTCLDYLKYIQTADPSLAFRKRHGSHFSTAGDPDIHGVWRGVPFELELKRPGQNPTPLQAQRLEEWRRSGAVTAVVHSLEELRQTLREVQNRFSR